MTQMQVLWLLQSRRGSITAPQRRLPRSRMLASALPVVWFTCAFSFCYGCSWLYSERRVSDRKHCRLGLK
jgi:hypothetical protein